MKHVVETTKVTIYETQGCLVVPIQKELTREAALEIQRGLLEQVYSKNIKGIVIDLSGVEVIDSILWEVFSKTSQMINVIGFPTVITGLSPGVVASIIDLDLDINTVTTSLNLPEALEILNNSIEPDMDDTELVENNDVFENQVEQEVMDDIEFQEVE